MNTAQLYAIATGKDRPPSEQSDNDTISKEHQDWLRHPFTAELMSKLEALKWNLQESVSTTANGAVETVPGVLMFKQLVKIKTIEKVLAYARSNDSRNLTE